LVVDAIFGEQRLADIYDAFDDDRSDLDAYVAMVDEFGAESILDIGCGTGTFACLLSRKGKRVVGVDPAGASLRVARSKSGAENVQWILGDASGASGVTADLATMTGNVAQVFLTDTEWADTLVSARIALRPGGLLIFETRNPRYEAWREWTPDRSYRRLDLPRIGVVEGWVDVTDVNLPLVSFRWTYRFGSDGATLESDSTLRFRTSDEVVGSLDEAGYAVCEIRDAPDRPRQEHVFIARSTR
jgi:SAM-dependent methyltransferase